MQKQRLLNVTFKALTSVTVPIPDSYPAKQEHWSREQEEALIGESERLVADERADWYPTHFTEVSTFQLVTKTE